jgi:LacI family transcriptional regulator/LacI family repressor for deo operon, udp, cdd, tsx, nupC, and nupG
MVSMNDVARRAGVSIATVSRVINGSPNLNPETKAKVIKAIKEMNYQPSRVAKRLRSRGNPGKLIGILIPDIQNPFYVDVLRGVEDIALQNNYALIMCNFGQDEKKEKLYLDMLRSEAVDGLLTAPTREDDPEVTKLLKAGMPIVCVDRGLKNSDVDVVMVNNQKGAFEAVDHLAKSGYKRIAYISGLPTIPSSYLREAGYREALHVNGLDYNPGLVRYGDSKYESGVVLCRELLESSNPPDALFTGNNLITLGALETIHLKKLSIPDEIAIIGFDDMFWSNSLYPSLSAVRQPALEIGKRAAELLIQRINDPHRMCIQMILNPELMIRNSC